MPRALVDTVALSDAVRVADSMTSPDDTLILVTADHSHTLTFAGYPMRGNPILGKVRGASGETDSAGPYALDALGRPYTTLSYANGPGYPGATSQQPEGPKRYRHASRRAASAMDESTAHDRSRRLSQQTSHGGETSRCGRVGGQRSRAWLDRAELRFI